MIPMGLSALVILMLLRPMRKKRLSQMNLVSSAWRETALVLFAPLPPPPQQGREEAQGHKHDDIAQQHEQQPVAFSVQRSGYLLKGLEHVG